MHSALRQMRIASNRCFCILVSRHGVLSGHSLGAGVASTVVLLLESELRATVCWLPDIQGICVAPPAIFSRSLAKLSEEWIISAVCAYDMIPRTSVANVDQLIHHIVSSSSRSKVLNKVAPSSGKERLEKLESLLVKEDDTEKQDNVIKKRATLVSSFLSR